MGFNRRQFTQGVVVASAGLGVESSLKGCFQADLKHTPSALKIEDAQIDVFIDGLVQAHRANVVIFLKLKQSRNFYLEKMVLANASHTTLGVRYFPSLQSTKGGYPNYLIFNQVGIRGQERLYIVMQFVQNGERKFLRRVLEKKDIARSTLTQLKLPQFAKEVMVEGSHKGQISTPFGFSKSLSENEDCVISRELGWPLDERLSCMTLHFFKARFIELKQDSFKLQIDYFFPEVNLDHYFRNFFVTDPVGNLLGFTQRAFLERKEGLSLVIERISKKDYVEKLGLDLPSYPSLVDCPYVMVFIEGAHALTKMNLYLY